MEPSINGPSYLLLFRPVARRRPEPRYEGLLRTHRLRAEYYTLLEGEDPSTVPDRRDPLILFPARYVEFSIDYSRQLGGVTAGVKRFRLRKGSGYESPLIVLPGDIVFRRHLLYTLTLSTYRIPARAREARLRSIISSMNANMLNLLTNLLLDRYRSRNGTPTWYWRMYRVAKALKVLYRLE